MGQKAKHDCAVRRCGQRATVAVDMLQRGDAEYRLTFCPEHARGVLDRQAFVFDDAEVRVTRTADA